MNKTLTISARNAGLVELAKYCSRCCWYLLRIKNMPFAFGMPGIMFSMEAAEKAFIRAYFDSNGNLPRHLKPFNKCTGVVDFPHAMYHLHEETGVIVSARPDMILQNPDGTWALIDLKTSEPDGGGKVFLPQYEIQVIGYSWVVNAEKIGKVTAGGIIYGTILLEDFLENPLTFRSGADFSVPFGMSSHEVPLDYKRFTKCLTEMNKLWQADRPPMGVDGCKDCKLWTGIVNFENDLRITDQQLAARLPEWRNKVVSQDFFRRNTRPSPTELEDLLAEEPLNEEGMLAGWDHS